MPRAASPDGGFSILMTSAPRSPMISPAVGPATMCESSRTFIPANGREAVGMSINETSLDQQELSRFVKQYDSILFRAERLAPLGQQLELCHQRFDGLAAPIVLEPRPGHSALAPDPLRDLVGRLGSVRQM